jgi:hypothetical protein
VGINRNASLVTKEPTPSTVVQMVGGGASDTRPSNPPLGYLYFDTSLGYEVVWNGTLWKALVPALSESTGFGPTSRRPDRPRSGFLYYDTTLKQELVWDGSAWIAIGPAGGDSGGGSGAVGTSQPVITVQPANQSVSTGNSATFLITATSTTTMSYQWQVNSVAISGANSSSYNTGAVTVPDSGKVYRCIVTNNAGSVTSSTATLTVSSGAVTPSITVNPANESVVVGNSAKFDVSATGSSPLFYQWRKNNANISGATSYSYTTPATTIADNGAGYDCVVTNTSGSATSTQGILTVASTAPTTTKFTCSSFTSIAVMSEYASLVNGFIAVSSNASSTVTSTVSAIGGSLPAGVSLTAVDSAGTVIQETTTVGGESVMGFTWPVITDGSYTCVVSKIGEDPIALTTSHAVAGTVLFKNVSLRAAAYAPSQYPPDGFSIAMTAYGTAGTAAAGLFAAGTDSTPLSSPDYSWDINGDKGLNPVAIVPGADIPLVGRVGTPVVSGDVRLDLYATD